MAQKEQIIYQDSFLQIGNKYRINLTGITDFFSRNSEKQEVKKINKQIALENEIMVKLAQYQEKNPEVLFSALRKYLSRYYLYTDDSGYIGIADNSYPAPLYYAGDILVHSTKADLKMGDILHFCQYTPNGSFLFHAKFKSVDRNGNIIIKGLEGGDGFLESKMILGVLIEVIPFKEKSWNKLFDGLIGDYDWLKDMIKASIDFYKSNDEVPVERKNKTIPELERRLKELEL